MRRSWLFALVAALIIAAACGASPTSSSESPSQAGRHKVASNVLRADYAGSKSCERCHQAIYDRWLRSPMHNMTRSALEVAPKGPFAGESIDVGPDRATMETKSGRRFVRVSRPKRKPGPGSPENNAPDDLFLVTKIIGGRYREDYAGVRVEGYDAAVDVMPKAGAEGILPASFLLFDRTWRYKGYSVMVQERHALSEPAEWSRACIGCHNTLPAIASLYDDLSPEPLVYQGSVSDTLLPDARRWKYSVGDEASLSHALRAEIGLLNRSDRVPDRPAAALLPLAARATETHLATEHLVELGVGCEACHNGAAEHVKDPSIHPTFAPTSAAIRLTPGHDAPITDAQLENRICARCHTVLFSRYEPTWEGGERRHDPGGSSINSGEARDFLLGGCSSKMRCATCHDPHGEDDRDALAALGTPAGNVKCTSCHEAYSSKAALEAHSKHPASSSACLGCHMPQKNMGLQYELTRYHRIGSPTDKARVENDRPLECALCHTDASVKTILGWIDKGWGKQYDTAKLERLYGRLDANVLEATLERGKPHEKVVAATLLAKHRGASITPQIKALEDSPFPLVRFWGRHAIDIANKHVTPSP